MHFRYTTDGTLSFRRGGSDIALDIDWSKPVSVSSWEPQEDGHGTMLYPFQLVYEPHKSLRCNPKRYLLLLGAPTKNEKMEWLSMLRQKISAFKMCSATHKARKTMLGGDPLLPGGSVASSVLREVLGEEESLGPDEVRDVPVPGGHVLWSQQTPLQVMQDLYDVYASNPLAQVRKAQDHRYVQQFVRKQAEIDDLLEGSIVESLSLPFFVNEAKWVPSTPPVASTPLPDEKKRKRNTEYHNQLARITAQAELQSSEQLQSLHFPIAQQTANMYIANCAMFNEKWSGAIVFSPSSASDFELVIELVSSPKTHPVFLGVVPVEADLDQVNLFDSQGYFLRLDGSCGTFFSGLGEASLSQTRLVAEEGLQVAVRFAEDSIGPLLHFRGQDPNGEEIWVSPPFTQPMDPGPWQPCVLLCLPETHVSLISLS